LTFYSFSVISQRPASFEPVYLHAFRRRLRSKIPKLDKASKFPDKRPAVPAI
jgi:hypothetical protein